MPSPAPIEVPPGWRVTDDRKRIRVDVETADFLSALDLFRAIGDVAEELEHHPDLHLEAYNRVRIESYSHDVGRLTERDAKLARRIADLLERRGLRPA